VRGAMGIGATELGGPGDFGLAKVRRRKPHSIKGARKG
jgi:hypothetical protein